MSKDLTAMSDLLMGANLKTLHDAGAFIDASEKNTGSPLRSGQGKDADFDMTRAGLEGEFPDDDEDPNENPEDPDEDGWRTDTLALIWRMFSNTFSGSGVGALGDIPTHLTVYDDGGSLHDSVWGRSPGPDSDVVRAFSNPFYNQVFSPGETRFGPEAAFPFKNLSLGDHVFGAKQDDPADDWFWRLREADKDLMSFTYGDTSYFAAVKYSHGGSLASAVFGSPELAEALSNGSGSGGFARAVFGTAELAERYAKDSLPDVGLAEAVMAGTEWAEVFSGPVSVSPDAKRTIVQSVFGTTAMAEEFVGFAWPGNGNGSLAEMVFENEAGVQEHLGRYKSIHRRIKELEALLEGLEGSVKAKLDDITTRLAAGGL